MRTLMTLLLLALGLAAPATAQNDAEKKPGELTAEQQKDAAVRLKQLGSSQFRTREKATRRLIAMGPAVGPLCAAALKQATDAETKWRLRKVLTAVGKAHLDQETLRENLKEKLRPLSNRALVSWNNTRWSSADAPTVDHRQGRATFEELKKVGKPAVPVLIAELQRENVALRVNVAYLLGELGDTAACPALIKALGDPQAPVQQIAAWALGRLRHESAIAPLVELARNSKDKQVRTAAMLSFLPLRQRKSIEPLVALLDEGGELGWNANWVLEQLTGHRTRYNPFREERRKAGAAGWREWYARHGKTFKFAYSGPRESSRESHSHRVRIEAPPRVIEVRRAVVPKKEEKKKQKK